MKDAKPKPESPLTSLMINIVIPVCILTFLSKEKYLGPVWALALEDGIIKVGDEVKWEN